MKAILGDESTTSDQVGAKESIKVSKGTMTRAQAELFKEQFNNLVQKVHREDLSLCINEGQ